MEPEEALEAETLLGSLRTLGPAEDLFDGQQAEAANRFAAELLAALGHRTRLRIISALKREPLTVNQISATLGITQANTSRHLAILLRAGALIREAKGAARRYSLRGLRIARILEIAQEFHQAHWEDIAAELVG